jgi:hypothetical protein
MSETPPAGRAGASATAVVVGLGTSRTTRSDSKTPAIASTATTRPTDAAPRKVKKTFEARLDRFMAHMEPTST